MPDAAWKNDERAVARILGGIRVPINGRGQAPDVRHARFAIEVKRTLRRIALVDRALAQAAEAKTVSGSDILPLAVIHYTGTHMKSARVIMTLGDFAAMNGVQLAPEFDAIQEPELPI